MLKNMVCQPCQTCQWLGLARSIMGSVNHRAPRPTTATHRARGPGEPPKYFITTSNDPEQFNKTDAAIRPRAMHVYKNQCSLHKSEVTKLYHVNLQSVQYFIVKATSELSGQFCKSFVWVRFCMGQIKVSCP